MDFNTPVFLFLFLPFFLIIYFAADQSVRRIVGIAGSLLFFAWGQIVYIPLMFGIIALNFWLAGQIEGGRRKGRRGRLLFAGVSLDLVLLIFFKVVNAYGGNILMIPGLPAPLVLWLQGAKYPLGLSYISFQLISYLVDVYKGICRSEKNLLSFSLYILLFPKILVGPITRYGALQDQLAHPQVSRQEIAQGIRRFIQGFAKKALIADTLVKIVKVVFSFETPMVTTGIAWLAIVSFALQIYFDFSGYTDMALGLGRMMGFRFIENFEYPYFAQSIGDFWRRWHISLSTWFRDYVFYPLERRRLKWIGQPLNILLVFLLVGLWHGLTLNFVAWGLVHGLFVAVESLYLRRRLQEEWRPIRHLYALTVVLVSWVFFRSHTLEFAVLFLRRLVGEPGGLALLPFSETAPLPIIDPSIWVAFGFGILFSMPTAPALQKVSARWVEKYPLLDLPLQMAYDFALLILFVASIAATVSGNFSPNIYGNF